MCRRRGWAERPRSQRCAPLGRRGPPGRPGLGLTLDSLTDLVSRSETASTVMPAGVSERVARQLHKTRAVSVIGGERIFRARRAVTESTRPPRFPGRSRSRYPARR